MMTLESIREQLQDRNLRKVSRAAGVGYSNLYAIATGANKNPGYQSLKKISDYLEQK